MKYYQDNIDNIWILNLQITEILFDKSEFRDKLQKKIVCDFCKELYEQCRNNLLLKLQFRLHYINFTIKYNILQDYSKSSII